MSLPHCRVSLDRAAEELGGEGMRVYIYLCVCDVYDVPYIF